MMGYTAIMGVYPIVGVYLLRFHCLLHYPSPAVADASDEVGVWGDALRAAWASRWEGGGVGVGVGVWGWVRTETMTSPWRPRFLALSTQGQLYVGGSCYKAPPITLNHPEFTRPGYPRRFPIIPVFNPASTRNLPVFFCPSKLLGAMFGPIGEIVIQGNGARVWWRLF